MIIYRIGSTKFSEDLSGEGARLHGGRWNHPLTPCIYSSESRALALLEFTVNVSIDNIPKMLSITSIHIPDNGILDLSIADLPVNWTESPAPAATKDFGTNFLKLGAFPIIKIPSTIINREFNFILNPRHVEFKKIKIVEIENFVYDDRIKSV